MVDPDVNEAMKIAEDIKGVLDEPGWTEEQWKRVRERAQDFIPIKEKWESELGT